MNFIPTRLELFVAAQCMRIEVVGKTVGYLTLGPIGLASYLDGKQAVC